MNIETMNKKILEKQNIALASKLNNYKALSKKT